MGQRSLAGPRAVAARRAATPTAAPARRAAKPGGAAHSALRTDAAGSRHHAQVRLQVRQQKAKCRAAARHARPGQGPAPDDDGGPQGRDPAGVRRKSEGAEVGGPQRLRQGRRVAGGASFSTRGACQWVARRRARGDVHRGAARAEKKGGRRGAVLGGDRLRFRFRGQSRRRAAPSPTVRRTVASRPTF